jgi:hypothetical protein
LASPSRSIRSARTADWPVSHVPLIEVRHTVLLPGVSKQNFCQSPYLTSRTILRSPSGAMVGLSPAVAPGCAACCARTGLAMCGDSSNDSTANAAIDDEKRLFMIRLH